MEVREHRVLTVAEPSQAGDARRVARDVAEDIGLDATEAGKVALVVTEMATNLVKHARDGRILLGTVQDGGTRRLLAVALDRGPGIADLARCLDDGFSTAGSPGTGLGAIHRLSTLFDIYSGAGGTVLVAGVGGTARGAEGRLQLGGLCVPMPGEEVAGDGWAVVQEDGISRIFVVDGLGHGSGAAEAAVAALASFRARPAGTPVETIERVHHALRGTRGAAAAVAEIDRTRRLVRFVGVGNVAGAVIVDARRRNMVSHHGVLGHEVRKIGEFTYPWPEGAVVVLHSDGVTTHWDLDAYPGIASRHPLVVAGILYRDFGRGRDDATVVVVRESA